MYLKTINQINISHRHFKTIYLSLKQINKSKKTSFSKKEVTPLEGPF